MGVNTKSPLLFKNKYRIESTRLKDWNYAKAGYYFLTICVSDRRCILGKVMDNAVNLSPQGKIVKEHWYDLPNHYQNCRLDEFVIMPNHIHGIIEIRYHDDTRTFTNTVETGLKPVSTINDETVGKQHSLFEIIRGFKTFSARRINKYQNTVGLSFWQARFYDHIIRNEKSLNNIRRYIQNNPLKWSMDKYNPDHKEWRHCDN